MKSYILSGIFAILVSVGCGSSDTATVQADLPEDAPIAFSNFRDGVTVYVEGDYVVVESKGVPDHKSPYYNTSNSLYEAYNGDNGNFHLNPNRIAEQNLTFRLPIVPQATSNNEATPLGPIGVSLNGVPFFNQYAGPNQPLTNEINSFDQYLGHPQQQGSYHYHVEPVYLTDLVGEDGLLGFLLDGFPVYGPREDGSNVTNQDLDAFHGHEHATIEYPDGIYHYHVTGEDPYINGSGFYGVAGTVSQ